ncbi:MAG: hypothetical protein IJ760_08585 [Bacteroidales bacterium]|nr:hypothetical protein [Bacteroidales bacterium]
MKKGLLFAALAAAALLWSSCRDEDKALLNHGYRIQGEVSPTFELPLSSGEMNLNDLLTKFGGALDGYITNDSVITFKYSMSVKDTVDVGGMIASPRPRHGAKKPIATKDGDALVSKDTVIEYTIPIDIFNQVDLLQDNDISIGHLWLSLHALVQGFCPDNVRDDLREFVWASIDSLAIQYDGKDGHKDFGVIEQASLRVNDLTADNRMEFDSVNLAEIVNALPTSITAKFRLHVNVDEGLSQKYMVDFSHIEYFQELLDSLRMTSLVYGADVNVDLPFEVSVGMLAYSYDMSLGSGSSAGGNSSVLDELNDVLNRIVGEGMSLDSSALTVVLRVDNGIPLNINLNGTVCDDNGLPLFVLLANDNIASAQTAPVAGTTGVSEAVAPTKSVIEVELSLERARQFVNASSLRLDMLMTTDGTDSKRIRRSDNLKLQMLVKVNPNIKIDMGVPGLSEGIPVIGNMF